MYGVWEHEMLYICLKKRMRVNLTGEGKWFAVASSGVESDKGNDYSYSFEMKE